MAISYLEFLDECGQNALDFVCATPWFLSEGRFSLIACSGYCDGADKYRVTIKTCDLLVKEWSQNFLTIR